MCHHEESDGIQTQITTEINVLARDVGFSAMGCHANRFNAAVGCHPQVIDRTNTWEQ